MAPAQETRTMHPMLNQTFWHGTCEGHLTDILAEGLVPSRFFCGHICLTNDPQIALFYARLSTNNVFGPKGLPVLIEIPPLSLNEASLVCESGTIDITAYGHGNPGRREEDLQSLKDDWEGLLQATGCLGVKDTLPVSASQVLTVEGLPDYTGRQFVNESFTGECCDAARRWLDLNLTPQYRRSA
jgi:hypothetical protein